MFHKFKINLSAILIPLSRNIAPIIASHASEIILSSITWFFLLDEFVFIYFDNSNDLQTSKHIFLLTNEASFLSSIPSLSFGYNSKSFLAITNPSILSPKNSNFSLLLIESELLWVSDLINKSLFLKFIFNFFSKLFKFILFNYFQKPIKSYNFKPLPKLK